ncbi:hypothetical protein A5776_12300 [Mycolicibacterium elephantis]|uniref:hypothetical protein n=1 Tax=Mycolicibacterium elephantis TaxID=81858 RepID=UPI0007EAF41A|nr:hypothetical protein [Mycolicibacterium elephantis]OBB18060.1 hypothetical protein A5762_21520 [Mycolicibacterium elephantis]OBE99304.1 hypothetical protein A5776_12300 [Mycolicibacterium elephantis]
MECQLDLSTARVADLISVAGGWLCDRALAGWTVTVWVPDRDHIESLSILGVTARESAAPVDALAVYGAPPGDVASLRLDVVRHHVSVAARAFKARALLLAGLPVSIAEVETFNLHAPSNTLLSREFVHTSVAALVP